MKINKKNYTKLEEILGTHIVGKQTNINDLWKLKCIKECIKKKANDEANDGFDFNDFHCTANDEEAKITGRFLEDEDLESLTSNNHITSGVIEEICHILNILPHFFSYNNNTSKIRKKILIRWINLFPVSIVKAGIKKKRHMEAQMYKQ